MAYQSQCPANPDKVPCPFDCTCLGHVKMYPNTCTCVTTGA